LVILLEEASSKMYSWCVGIILRIASPRAAGGSLPDPS